MKKFAQMILDRAKRYGDSTIVKKTTNPIWLQAESQENHKLQEVHMVTKSATPSAYETYMAP